MLTDDQLAEFRSNGVIILPELLCDDEVDAITARLPRLFRRSLFHRTFVNDRATSFAPRWVLHLRDELFAQLVRDPRFVEPAQQILDEDELYIQQVKVNAKEAFTGEAVAVALRLRHAPSRRRRPRAARAQPAHLPRRGDRVQRTVGLHPRLASRRSGADDARHHDDQLPVVDRRRRRGQTTCGQKRLYCPKGPPGTVLIFADTMLHSSPPTCRHGIGASSP